LLTPSYLKKKLLSVLSVFYEGKENRKQQIRENSTCRLHRITTYTADNHRIRNKTKTEEQQECELLQKRRRLTEETNSYSGKHGSTALDRSVTNKLCQTSCIQVRCILIEGYFECIEKRMEKIRNLLLHVLKMYHY